MAKVTSDKLKSRKPIITPHKFVDGEGKPLDGLDEALVLWLRPLHPLEEDGVAERADELFRIHVKGGWYDEDARRIQNDPMPIMTDDGRIVKLTHRGCQLGACLELMQEPEKEEDRYSAQELFRLSPDIPETWDAIRAVWADYANGAGWGKA